MPPLPPLPACSLEKEKEDGHVFHLPVAMHGDVATHLGKTVK